MEPHYGRPFMASKSSQGGCGMVHATEITEKPTPNQDKEQIQK